MNISKIIRTWLKDENGMSISPGAEWLHGGRHPGTAN